MPEVGCKPLHTFSTHMALWAEPNGAPPLGDARQAGADSCLEGTPCARPVLPGAMNLDHRLPSPAEKGAVVGQVIAVFPTGVLLGAHVD
jgi:hypothetical protein